MLTYPDAEITILQMFLSMISGVFVGFSLGLIGGGGSILAVPLLLYFVGLSSLPNAAHIALGTTALAVGLNAYANSFMHIKKHNVAPKIGTVFAGSGLVGSLLGAYLGHITPGTSLLLYFSIVMIILGIYITISRKASGAGTQEELAALEEARKKCFGFNAKKAIKVAIAGLAIGFLSGYFGIGGGFLIVPALIFSSGVCIRLAIGTSLISVGTFGLATGLEYMFYGNVILSVSLLYLLGGLVGGYMGTSLAVKIPRDKLRIIYGAIIVIVGIYMLLKTLGSL
ncbi:MAG: sulfite exporter TauE/SafE family protein [Fervidicoccaceae archaeon]